MSTYYIMDFGSLGRDIGSGLSSIGSYGQHAAENTLKWSADNILGNAIGAPLRAIENSVGRPVLFLSIAVVGSVILMKLLERK